jgi:hypothetical protein
MMGGNLIEDGFGYCDECFSVENCYFTVLWRDFSGNVREGRGISAWWRRYKGHSPWRKGLDRPQDSEGLGREQEGGFRFALLYALEWGPAATGRGTSGAGFWIWFGHGIGLNFVGTCVV